MLRSQKGMTLVEIMIVLAILGGLIAILGSTVFGALDRAKVKEAGIQMKELGKQLEIYYSDCNSFPTTDHGLQALLQSPGDDACSGWGPEAYIRNDKQLKDPWGRPFLYESDGSQYTLKSLGKDGREGGEGYGKDIDSNAL